MKLPAEDWDLLRLLAIKHSRSYTAEVVLALRRHFEAEGIDISKLLPPPRPGHLPRGFPPGGQEG